MTKTGRFLAISHDLVFLDQCSLSTSERVQVDKSMLTTLCFEWDANWRGVDCTIDLEQARNCMEGPYCRRNAFITKRV